MVLSSEIAQYLHDRARAGVLEVWQAPLEVLRAGSYARILTAGIPQSIFSIQDRYIPGPTADLHIRVYRPNERTDRPALLYFHGGGWVFNNLDFYDGELSALANDSHCVVIALNYQKAPEHPYPVPFEDCYAAMKWVFQNATSLGIDSTRIGVGGESAGANLAAAVVIKNRDECVNEIAYQLLINPCMERDFATSSYEAYESGYGLTRQAMQWYWDQYLQGDAHDKDPYACPSTAKDFSSLPTAIIVTAECDPLKDDGIKYERLLRQAGVQTYYKEYEGMIHGFANLGAITPVAGIALRDCAEIIKAITH